MSSAGHIPAPVAYHAVSTVPPYPAALTIIGAAWRSTLTRENQVVLARSAVQIGRMEGNDVILSDPLVSRYHAAVRWAPGGYELEDLGAANGTYIQGKRVQGRTLLTPGQMIRIGNTEMLFHVLGHHDQSGMRDQSAGGATGRAPASFAGAFMAPGAYSPGPQIPGGMLGRMAQGGMPPAHAAAAANAAATIHPFYEALARPSERGLIWLIKSEARKSYWRVFLLGLLAYLTVAQVLADTDNLHLVPLAMLLASGLIPVVFVIFCWEQSAFADMPAAVVGATFMSGAILGLTIAAIVEPLLLPAYGAGGGISLFAAILIGLCEETAKVISIVWFLRDRRLRSELDGLILGAAAGMGFAALETAGYGFVAFLAGFSNVAGMPGATVTLAITRGISQMNYQLLLRMALAIFGHGIWTAIVCAAIWRERGQAVFRLTSGVLGAFGIAVALHALWDWSPLIALLAGHVSQDVTTLVTVGWFLFIGMVGLFFLRFFLRESLDRAKLGPLAPPPPPLLKVLLENVQHPFGRLNSHGSHAQQWQPSSSATANTSETMLGKASAQGGVPGEAGRAGPVQPPYAAQAGWPGVPPVAQGAVMVYCPRCTTRYPTGMATCPRCGSSLIPLR